MQQEAFDTGWFFIGDRLLPLAPRGAFDSYCSPSTGLGRRGSWFASPTHERINVERLASIAQTTHSSEINPQIQEHDNGAVLRTGDL
jgi:hypothetical protein